MYPSSPATAPTFNVAAKSALGWTLLWVSTLSIYALAHCLVGAYSYDAYKFIANAAAGLLAILTLLGVATAWQFIGGKREDPPWYTHGFLVALLIFWALAPPIWFFLEYYLFDTGAIKLPPCVGLEDFLKQIKVYADLGSKVWAAAGATLGAAVAAARK
jgi:hypothetical protein